MNSGGTASTPLTPVVFCAVRAVTTLAPYTPKAVNVLRSAWIPAPPELSEPAMVSATGVGAGEVIAAEVMVPGRLMTGSLLANLGLQRLRHECLLDAGETGEGVDQPN